MSLTILAFGLSGCAIKRDRYDIPLVPLPDQFHQSADAPTAEAAPAEPDGRQALPLDGALDAWWRLLANPELDGLIERALAGNPDLRIAGLRVMQAQARASQAVADEVPVVTAPLRISAEAPEDGVGTVPPGGDVKSEKNIEASLRADWRLDLWGERRAMAESAERRLWRATFQRDDTQRTLVSDVATAYLEYLSMNDRLKVARETEGVLQGMLDAMEMRLEKGDTTLTEVEQQRTAVHAVRATLPVLELQREEVLNRLGTLTGAVPGGLALPEQGLDSLRYPVVAPGVPAALLLRRPDVRVAETELLAADADIDVARARILPPLDLSAQIGYGSRHFSQMFDPHTLFWNAIADLSITIFDRGRRDRDVDFARALHEELTENYVRVVYRAVRETEDALAATRLSGKRLAAQGAAMEAARRAWGYSQEAYAAGAIDYLTLLDTQRTYHQSLDEWHRVHLERYRAAVSLFKALGGGTPRGGPLPGRGARPAGAAASGVVLAAAQKPAETRGLDWDGSGLKAQGERWLAELPGVFDRGGAAAAWHALQRSHPRQAAGRSALPRPLGRVEDRGHERVTLHRLFIAAFPDRRAAEAFCAELREDYRTCRAVSSKSGAFKRPVLSPPAAAQARAGQAK